MRSRLIITALLIALAAPLAVEAQQARVVRIGYLSLVSASADAANVEAFRQGLRDQGFVEGQNAVIEARHADGGSERLPGLAAELVHLKVDVVVASTTSAVRAAQQASPTIPIVMAFTADPVGEKLVASLARPGGNVTGLSATVSEMAVKRLEVLKVIVPHIARAAFLVNPATAKAVLGGGEAAGRVLGVPVSTLLVRDAKELEQAFATLKKAPVGGLIVDLTLQDEWKRILDFAFQNRLPTVSGPRAFIAAGGLAAYGPHFPDLFHRSATYVARILKGAKPADLPVEQATRFELALNLRTAKALGLTIPQSLVLQADEVIQ
jgi:putative tryptophan/tyrosine transport system substrate-binding protein